MCRCGQSWHSSECRAVRVWSAVTAESSSPPQNHGFSLCSHHLCLFLPDCQRLPVPSHGCLFRPFRKPQARTASIMSRVQGSGTPTTANSFSAQFFSLPFSTCVKCHSMMLKMQLGTVPWEPQKEWFQFAPLTESALDEP